MRFNTGDVLVWRSSNLYDLIAETLIPLPGYHCGVILCGGELEKYSKAGKSPSATYVTFLVDQLYPIEEVIGHIWHRPNGVSLIHIQRMDGFNVNGNVVANAFDRFIALEKQPFINTVYASLMAYFRIGDMLPSTGYNGQRHNVCSIIVGHFLTLFGYMDTVTNNLLPMDYANLRFGQTVPYQRHLVFDKGTNRMGWALTSLLDAIGSAPMATPIVHPQVSEILKNYPYPQTNNKIKGGQDKEYLSES